MTIKSQFLNKLQTRQPALTPTVSKCQADITEFRLRITQLQEQMDGWLVGTGLSVETFTVSVMDLLVENGAFDNAGIVLHVDDRSVTFVPIFLYGQGVTGGVEVTFHNGGHMIALGRLFMRSGTMNYWTYTPPGGGRPGQGFEENCFFGLILALLP